LKESIGVERICQSPGVRQSLQNFETPRFDERIGLMAIVKAGCAPMEELQRSPVAL
jgi:hypothetical protein